MAGVKKKTTRNAEILALKTRGRTNVEIAEMFGIGKHRVGQIITAEIRRSLTEEDREQVRQIELAKLDELEREAWRILEANYYAYTPKGLIKGPEGRYLEDSAPVLAAMDRILKIQERRAKMLGIDAPTRVQITGDLIEQEIARLERALAHNDPKPELEPDAE